MRMCCGDPRDAGCEADRRGAHRDPVGALCAVLAHPRCPPTPLRVARQRNRSCVVTRATSRVVHSPICAFKNFASEGKWLIPSLRGLCGRSAVRRLGQQSTALCRCDCGYRVRSAHQVCAMAAHRGGGWLGPRRRRVADGRTSGFRTRCHENSCGVEDLAHPASFATENPTNA